MGLVTRCNGVFTSVLRLLWRFRRAQVELYNVGVVRRVILTRVNGRLFGLLVFRAVQGNAFRRFLSAISGGTTRLVCTSLEGTVHLRNVVTTHDRVTRNEGRNAVRIRSVNVRVGLDVEQRLLRARFATVGSASVLKVGSSFVQATGHVTINFLLLVVTVNGAYSRNTVLAGLPSLRLVNPNVRCRVFVLRQDLRDLCISERRPANSTLVGRQGVVINVPLTRD